MRRVLQCVCDGSKWHQTLDVGEFDDEAVIRSGYKNLARLTHPDKATRHGVSKDEANEAFRAVAEALEEALKAVRYGGEGRRRRAEQHAAGAAGSQARPGGSWGPTRVKVDLGVWFRVGCPDCVHEYEVEEQQEGQNMGCVWCGASFLIRRPNAAAAAGKESRPRGGWREASGAERRAADEKRREAEGTQAWASFSVEAGVADLMGAFTKGSSKPPAGEHVQHVPSAPEELGPAGTAGADQADREEHPLEDFLQEASRKRKRAAGGPG